MSEKYFGLRLTGMKPADVRAGELAKIISAFEDMIASTVKRERPQISKEELGVGLVKIENASVGLEFATKLPELTISAYDGITTSIATEKFLDLPSDTLRHLREIHSFIKSKNCEGELLSRNGKAILKAVLLPTTHIPQHPKVKVQTVIYGRIVRVGGADPRVMFEAASGKTLFCGVKSEQLARKLGQRLYSWGGLKGTATLDSDSLEILDFQVDDLTEYEGKLSLKNAFSELRNLASEYYDDVDDVDDYIAGLRG
jgi:hypothetical protein